MTVTLTDAVRGYLTDATLRAAVDDLVDQGKASEELHLPFAEARDFNRARMMAEIAKADMVDLLFSIHEATYGLCEFGEKFPPDHDCQFSFMPDDIWRDSMLGVAYPMVSQNMIPHALYSYLAVCCWKGEIILYAHLGNDESDGLDFNPPALWSKKPADDDWTLGAVGSEGFSFEQFAQDPGSCIEKMRAQAKAISQFLHP